MIILSGVLVVVAIGLLVAGLVAGRDAEAEVLGLETLTVLYISIAVSIVSALCLAIGVFLRRRELLGIGASPRAGRKGSERKGGKGKGRAERAKAPASAPAGAGGAKPAAAAGRPARVPDEALVHVVPGRKRYHLSTCRQVAGRDTEELTYVEAREEGFTPCTACMPDTALAARAAASGPSGGKQGKQAEAADKAGAAAEHSASSAKDASAGGATAVLDKPAAPPAPAPAPAGTVPSAWSAPSVDPDAKTAPVPVPEQSRPEEPPAESSSGDPEVRILSGTKRYHSSNCALIEDIGDDTEELESLPLSEARSRGCTPCLVCQPDKAHA
ncbi:hypothetical protein [Thermomonospora amylolytica]|uniref:hypothetical protein n=1 Tax=Thermomonospora amylolytica TaxID=1411117 RepID=UPI000E6CCD72|nr:hypothetical protein [Thermomonospora amylolytica]